MNKLNIKKLMPGIVSIIIIVGMAVQSFATNVDMAAFVKKDKYMTKYYELDWRIDEVEQTLERLYKFTCTNVKSFGGTTNHAQEDFLFNINVTAQTYHWYGYPVVDISEEGYLKVAPNDSINFFSGHSKTDSFVREVPASFLRWRDGVELYPNTKVKTVISRTSVNGGAYGTVPTYSVEVIMGPFKKFPHITTTGTGGTIFVGDGFFSTIRGVNYSMYYRYNTDTEPTSWTSMSTGVLSFSAADRGNTNLPTSLQEKITMEDIEDVSYSGDYRKAMVTPCYAFPNAVFGVNVSSYDKLWLRSYGTTTLTNPSGLDIKNLTLTTWNNNK